MLHHTRTSIGSDDVTMLRLQLFFFHTPRLRRIHVKRISINYAATISINYTTIRQNTLLFYNLFSAYPNCGLFVCIYFLSSKALILIFRLA